RIDHIVPGNAIVGDYEYLVRISTYSDMLTVMGQNGAEFSIYSSSQVSESYEENLWETFFSGFNNGNEKSIDNIPNEFILRQNRPNPFNATTAINFSLSQSSEIRLDIYNIRGQKVESLISGHYSEGEYSVDWDASDYSSGVYFYKLSTDKNAFTKRMTLLK
ncbi:MAG: T9SS type A sorting domain-containing protein, partial [candidate division Zixibacteria bacterium]|nr:T9SS type A sorting domain-containing protein [candidate division Zixibacteria bacterium]